MQREERIDFYSIIKEMINITKLNTCLAGLIGFENSIDQDLPKIADDLTSSSSGIYVDHSLITIANILACIEYGGTINIPPDYTAGTYQLNSLVLFENEIYKSLANDNAEPLTDTTKWENLGNVITYYLRNKLQKAGVTLVNQIQNFKNLQESSKTVLGDLTIFQGAGNIRNTIPKSGRFVGFKLWMKEEGLSVVLSKIGLQLSDLNPNFKLYLYHSSQVDPVKIFDLAYTKEFSAQWLSIADYILSYSQEDIEGGHFSIGYYEDDIVGEAIDRKINIFKWDSCGSCNPINSNLFRKRSPYLSIQPFYVNSSNIEADRTLWNEETEIIVNDQNWGLNLQLSIFCDVTDIFCRNKSAIAQALALQVSILILKDMAYGVRDNQQFAKVSQLAMYAIGTPKDPGDILDDFNRTLKTLSFNFSGINKRCLPCDLQAGSIEFTTVY